MKKVLLKFTIFFTLFIIFISNVSDPIFKSKSNFHRSMKHFNEVTKDSIDILFMGSSHAVMSYIPFYFDQSLNVNSHNLGCAGQRLILTNQILENVLKKSNPELLIIDFFWGSVDYPDTEQEKGLQLSSFDEMKLGIDKLKLAHKIYGLRDILPVLSPTLRNHDNWHQVLFQKNKNTTSAELWSKGFRGTHNQMRALKKMERENHNSNLLNFINEPDQYNKNHRVDFDFSELKKTIQICKENNVKLVVVATPDYKVFDYPVSKNFYISFKKFCASNNIDFVNFHNLFNELQFTPSDFRDFGHLNVYGADKISSYLIEFLINKGYYQSNIDLKNKLTEIRKEFIRSSDQYEINDITSWINNNIEFKPSKFKSNDNEMFTLERANISENAFLRSKKINVNKGDRYRFEVTAKKGTYTKSFGVRISGVYPNRVDAVFDLANGTLKGTYVGGEFDDVQAKISEGANGQFKCEISGRVNSNFLQILLGPTNEKNPVNIWESKSFEPADVLLMKNSFVLEKL